MSDAELVSGYKKIIDDQTAMIKSCFELIEDLEKRLNMPKPSFTQGLLGDVEILAEHLKKNTGEPLEFDNLKISDEERKKRIGARIKSLRKGLKLTQTELGTKTGLKPQVISIYEAGTQEPSLKNLISLSRALNTSTDWLLGEPPPQS